MLEFDRLWYLRKINMAQAAFLYSDEFLKYKFSETHPLQQRRLQMIDRLLDAYGVYSRGDTDRLTPTPIDPELLRRVHSEEYLNALHRLSDGQAVRGAERYGFGRGDNPPFAGMWEASLLYAGASLDAANLVLSGKNRYAFNSSGGLHHAMRARAAGFCLLNDNAVAAYAAIDKGMRVAYIDIDAHHGDGTQFLFYDDPRVLTVSLHESGAHLFPGTGSVDEIGEGAGTGYSINVPMSPWSTDDHYAYAFDEAVEPIVRAFNPDFIILNVGADAHWEDPLAHLMLTSYGWLDMVDRVLAMDRPLIALGGGGYNIKTVARLWTLLQARLSGFELPDETPSSYVGEYGISNLHDTDKPRINQENMAAATEHVRRTVGELKGLVGERYGI